MNIEDIKAGRFYEYNTPYVKRIYFCAKVENHNVRELRIFWLLEDGDLVSAFYNSKGTFSSLEEI